MRTSYATTVDLDSARLAKDLEHSTTFKFSEAYSNYLIGGPWKSVMLWAAGGDEGDGLINNYQYGHGSTFTDYGRQLPYLQELISTVANPARLHFVRLAVISDLVIMPHRDYIELAEIPDDDRIAHRMHIPLATNDECYFSEYNTVYRMRAGEVWYFDAAQIHSAASFSNEPRTHLIFDFIEKPDAGPILSISTDDATDGIPADRTVPRPRLSADERAMLSDLAGVLTMDTFNEVFGIVIKTHFRRDGGEDFAWETMAALARASADPAVLPHTQKLRRYFTLARPA
jgi:hypothetical protein